MIKYFILILVLLVGCSVAEEINLEKYDVATLAGGCFWCMEASFEELDGVVEVVSGFTGGSIVDPSYADVISGSTGHYEAVQIYYNSSLISYSELLDYFWRNIDPLDSEGQFVDKGSQYMTAVFYSDVVEKELAEKSKDEVVLMLGEVVTEILPVSEFYEAEEYHQDYYKKRFVEYNLYEKNSGRAQRLKELWDI